MSKVIYIDHEENRHEIEVPNGWSVMEGGVQNGMDRIVAECGGCCSCATCHVFVDPEWIDKLMPADAMEEDMLDGTAVDRTECSRLSCQIKVNTELDGLIVRLPETQN